MNEIFLFFILSSMKNIKINLIIKYEVYSHEILLELKKKIDIEK